MSQPPNTNAERQNGRAPSRAISARTPGRFCGWRNFPTATRSPANARPRGNRSVEVDVLFVNPPTPDGTIWIRSQHRVGRRSRENMIWPQVSLAQLAAVMHPTYTVRVIDAVADRLDWPTFERMVRQIRPSLLRHARHRRHAPERSLRHLPRQIRRRHHARARDAHHADAARDAARVSDARLRAARRTGPHAAGHRRSPRRPPVRASARDRAPVHEPRRRLPSRTNCAPARTAGPISPPSRGWSGASSAK